MASSQQTNLKAKGLYTLSNPLSGAVPEGSFADAKNVVVDRNEIIEPRRGFYQYQNSFGVGTDRAKQLLTYKDSVLRHVLNEIQYDLNGAFTAFSGLPVLEIQEGLRIKSVEANGNLYFTSSTGIRKISARDSSDFENIEITEAGGIKALSLTATPDYSSPGFLTPNSKVAYRIVWCYNDLNENLIIGVPSARSVVYNLSLTDSCITNLEFSIPTAITSTNYFYQVYRTGVFAGEVDLDVDPYTSVEPIDPGEEMFLVFEDTLTSAQLTAGVVEVTDITPEDFRRNGTPLYINPDSGDGIASANEAPPFATDIAEYKGYNFYANTSTTQRLNLSFLSVQGLGPTNTKQLTITDGVSTEEYYFQGSIETYTVDFDGTSIIHYHNSTPAEAKYFTLTSANDETKYVVFFRVDATNDLTPVIPGTVLIEVTITGSETIPELMDKVVTTISAECDDFNFGGAGEIMEISCANNGWVTDAPTTNIVSFDFSITKDGLGTGEDAINRKVFLPRVPTGSENGPTPAQQLEQVANSLINVLNQYSDVVYAYYLSGYDDVPGQVLLEQQLVTGPAFTLTSNAGNQFAPTVPASGTSLSSSNEVRPNRIYYSKYQQPEAVPLTNYIDIGPKDRAITRIIALRDSLFVFKEDGIYRLSGETAPFVVNPFDFSAQLLAPDTAVVLNNQIYALSTQGAITVTDSAVSVISRPIENLLKAVTREGFNYKTASFGVSYETDRAYLLYTVTQESDTVATQCFRYNTFTSVWTPWEMTATCGIVNFADDKMYIGAGDINYVEKERKNLDRTDHADREYQLEVALNGVDDTTVEVNSVSQVSIGDVLIQTQYLTSSQFNRMLTKLDDDISVADNDYYTLEFQAGQDIRNKIIDLANKMDADTGIVYSQFFDNINTYSYDVIDVVKSSGQTVLTTDGPHSILPTRYISVDSTTTLYQVASVTSDTITINATVQGTPLLTQTASSSFQDVQACFNLMVSILNLDSGAFFSNYPLSNGTIDFEIPILSYDKAENTVEIKTPQILMRGEITLYKAIPTEVIWNPIYFQDPSLTKQVREGTMIFENSNFSKATIGYSTDLSPYFEDITFEGDGLGVGDWGYFNFGTINWGGVAAPIPLRTFIPRNKQKCRFMNVKFSHNVAFEKYAIYGLSLTYRIISTRGYR